MMLPRLMQYTQSIEESKLGRISRNLKRSDSSNQGQLRFKNRAQGQKEPRSAKVKLEKGGGSQNGKPTRDTCGNKHYGECLRGTVSCFGCVKEGHQLGDCPTIEARERKGKQVAPNVPKDDAPNNRCSYAL